MKTISLIFFLIGISFFGYTQEATTEEIKGKNNTYIKIDFGSKNSKIYNKSYQLMHREEYPGEYYNIPKGKIENKRKMHEAVEKHILPYVKKYLNTMSDSEGLIIGFVSELDGIIKEVTFYYPTDWNIPIAALEDLETELLSIPLTFRYEKNHPVFKLISTVDRNYAYGKNKFTTLRDKGATWIIDDEDLIRVPEVGNPKPDPKPDKPIIIIDDGTDSNPINEDNPLDRPLF